MLLRQRIHGLAWTLTAALVVATAALLATEDISEQAIRNARGILTGHGTVLDENGIPLVRYGANVGGIREPQRNPVATVQASLQHAARLAAGDTAAARLFLNCANWLIETAAPHGDWATLEYLFPFPRYRMTPPWRSGMAQGCALEALVVADSLTRDPKYLDMARRLLAAFEVDVENGGVRDTTVPVGWWYEEYADQGGVRSRVLNGMIFALFGIHRYYEYTGASDTSARLLFDNGVAAVRELLPAFDRRTASMYDLAGHAASDNYHAIHIGQLRRLSTITQLSVFEEYAERWAGFQSLPMVARLAIRPTALGFAMLFLNLIPATGLVVVVRIALVHWLAAHPRIIPHFPLSHTSPEGTVLSRRTDAGAGARR